MDAIAQTYVKLVLALGQHDPNYVDAYYGPPEWKIEAETAAKPLESIRREAADARQGIDRAKGARERNLARQLDALIVRAEMVSGTTFAFDAESAGLYDVVAPRYPDAHYAKIIAGLESRIPGEGSLTERIDRFRADFAIPKERLEAVFQTAIEAARERTQRYIPLPDDESFAIEYVSGEVWSAYNWYQGHSHSLIQVNTDFPMSIDRAIGLACHEGYPGHHVYNLLLEKHLARGNGWVEFTVYPLYSPQSLIAEGTAEYGVELCFPSDERLAFEREVLYPLADLDSTRVEEYRDVVNLIGELGTAGNDAARCYLDGEATREETLAWLVKYALATPERAAQRVRFYEAHRSYTVTYNVGEELVRDYVEARAKTHDERWTVFADLLSNPRTPRDLKRAK